MIDSDKTLSIGLYDHISLVIDSNRTLSFSITDRQWRDSILNICCLLMCANVVS